MVVQGVPTKGNNSFLFHRNLKFRVFDVILNHFHGKPALVVCCTLTTPLKRTPHHGDHGTCVPKKFCYARKETQAVAQEVVQRACSRIHNGVPSNPFVQSTAHGQVYARVVVASLDTRATIVLTRLGRCL
jgi:hypothetical protein